MRYLLILSILLLIAGCDFAGAVKEFEGHFMSIESQNELMVECSDVAKRGDMSGTEEGLLCTVQISEDTVIRSEEGNTLTVEDLEKIEIEQMNSMSKIRVILTDDRDIDQSLRSRTGLKADEIIFLK